MMDRGFAHRFAAEWIAAWNAHDLERILTHYEDDFEMSSPVIAALAGEASGRLRGKAAVGAYWAKALAKTAPDPDHSAAERRYLIFGCSKGGRHLVISFTERGDRIRLISARTMTPRERKAYEQ